MRTLKILRLTAQDDIVSPAPEDPAPDPRVQICRCWERHNQSDL